MSWYSLYKISQIWNYQGENSFEDNIKGLYEFEYKYLKVKQSNILEPRKTNILNKLHEAFKPLAENITQILKKTFEDWLNSHALLDPNEWASKRTEELDPNVVDDLYEEKIDAVLIEYSKYSNAKRTQSFEQHNEQLFQKIVNQIFKNIDAFPNFKNFIQHSLLPDYRNYLFDTLESEGIKEFGSMYNKKFRTNQQAVKYIETMGPEQIDQDIFEIFIPEKSKFSQLLSNSQYENYVIKELYQNLVFPLWRLFWVNKGIEGTRENIESIYNALNQINYNNMGETSSTINMAINAAHQSGSMLEYVEKQTNENDLGALLKDLTKGMHNQDWDQELKEQLHIQ